MRSVGSHESYVVLLLPVISSVICNEILKFSKPWFLHLKLGTTIPTSMVVREIGNRMTYRAQYLNIINIYCILIIFKLFAKMQVNMDKM